MLLITRMLKDKRIGAHNNSDQNLSTRPRIDKTIEYILYGGKKFNLAEICMNRSIGTSIAYYSNNIR